MARAPIRIDKTPTDGRFWPATHIARAVRGCARVAIMVAIGLPLSGLGLAQAAPGPEERRQAIGLADEGARAFQGGDYEGAEARFAQAHALAPVPSFALWHARALRRLGRLIEADQRYAAAIAQDVSDMKDKNRRVQDKAKLDAVRERAELTERIPRLNIRFDADSVLGATVYVDDVPVELAEATSGLALDPGLHRVRAVAGSTQVSETVVLAVGDRRTVVLALVAAVTEESRRAAAEAKRRQPKPAPFVTSAERPRPPPSSPVPPVPRADPMTGFAQRVGGWTLGGLGVLFMGAAGLIALDAKKGYDSVEGCSGTVCQDQRALDEREKYRSVGDAATVGFVIGTAMSATGIVLLVTAPSASEEIAQSPSDWRIGVSARGAVLQGSF
jgi:hypothetical protein